MKRIHLIIVLFCVCAIGFLFFWFSRNKPRIDKKSTYTIPRTIRYGFTIKNTTNHAIKNALFKTWAPVQQNATQKCESITATHAFSSDIDKIGNQMLLFNLDDFPPYGSREITITASMILSELPLTVNNEEPSGWLSPEQYIESNHPDLKKTASNLKTENIGKTAEKIFNWVTGHLSYSGYVKKDRGALYAYNYRQGDCTEYMYLFVALCRSVDIPARGVAGYICDRNRVLKSADYHNWAEFSFDGKWHVADPQKKQFMTEPSHYIAMKILTPVSTGSDPLFHRFQLIGKGLEARMN